MRLFSGDVFICTVRVGLRPLQERKIECALFEGEFGLDFKYSVHEAIVSYLIEKCFHRPELGFLHNKSADIIVCGANEIPFSRSNWPWIRETMAGQEIDV